MSNIDGTVAFVTGGGSGIGLAVAKALANRGASVMLADINADLLANAKSELDASGAKVATVVCDVSDEAAMRNAADATMDAFGAVNIIVNNAGVGMGGQPGKIDLDDWRWIVDINLMGVVYGVEIFTPLIEKSGGGHIVNVASMAGHMAAPGMGPYNATKFAVVGYSESLAHDLSERKIGVSVLCPGWVRTNIHKSSAASPSGSALSEGDEFSDIQSVIESGLDPSTVAEWTADCIEADRFYVFTHGSMKAFIEGRHAMVQADFDASMTNPAFKGR
ncbi:MAG: SDR family NAD(P)-dependent oxidoreductase [Hyphomonadaceae bacterium]